MFELRCNLELKTTASLERPHLQVGRLENLNPNHDFSLVPLAAFLTTLKAKSPCQLPLMCSQQILIPVPSRNSVSTLGRGGGSAWGRSCARVGFNLARCILQVRCGRRFIVVCETLLSFPCSQQSWALPFRQLHNARTPLYLA